ncbi:MAG: S8 family serine peptidase [Bacteroidales bacterium]|nr:S8 family serine peptidase [Bacteroidales bacterium]
MKKIFLILTFVSIIIFGSCERTTIDLSQPDDETLYGIKNGDIIPGQYIVLFKDGVTSVKSAKLSYPSSKILMRSEIKKLFASSDIPAKEPLQVYTAAFEGFAVRLSDEEAEALAENQGVLGIWPDRMFILKKPVPVQPEEQTPYGITRVGGGADYTGDNVAWIIDTGIDLDHPDLNVSGGVNLILPTRTADDDNGHGTHCAGIVAAKNDNYGVVGVAAGATVVPVKVLDRRGSGAYSVIIAGVDHVHANGKAGDAVNISLGGPVYTPLDDAVIELGIKGLFVAIAAGNEGDDAGFYSPSRTEGIRIYTISACDINDAFASWSNYGSVVDYCAPGVSIYSTYKGGTYKTLSGTSMAAPHMCGVLLVTKGDPKSDGYVVSGDPDGVPDPIVSTGQVD